MILIYPSLIYPISEIIIKKNHIIKNIQLNLSLAAASRVHPFLEYRYIASYL